MIVFIWILGFVFALPAAYAWQRHRWTLGLLMFMLAVALHLLVRIVLL